MKESFFQNGFLWGAATSSHQIEGANFNSDWYQWERKNKIKDGSSSNPGCNSGDNLSRDIELIKNLNLNSYRFSIEWAKIQPKEDVFDDKEMLKYLDFVNDLINNNIEPILTLFHFSLPLWFSNKGGFEKKENIIYFTNFVRKIGELFKGKVQFYNIINEPIVYIYMSYIEGLWPPGIKNEKLAYEIGKNLLYVYDESYSILKEIDKTNKISIAKHTAVYDSYKKYSLLNNYIKNKIENYFDHSFIDSILNNKFEKPFGKREKANFTSNFDYLGINYYTKRTIKYEKHNPVITYSKGNKTDIGWLFYPEGIYNVLKRFEKYNLPILITENGIADKDDRLRNIYIIKTLHTINHCMQKDIKILGYIHWTLMDNFEWLEGQSMKFGLYHTNFKNYKFTLRNSANIFSNIVLDNRIPERYIKFIQ